MELKHHITTNLKRLRLPGIAESLDNRLREARENKMGYLEFLSLLIQDEVIIRNANNLEKRIRAAGFSTVKTFEGFDFNFNEEAIGSCLIRDLAACHFIHKKQNLAICGPPGIGKSHIASALGFEVCKRGKDALFRKTHRLLVELSDPLYPKRCERLYKKALGVDILILDDFAFRKYTQKEAEILYTLADERLGKTSTVITSNRPPHDWYGVFPDPVIGGAILDRFISGAIKIITTKGLSYRKERGVSFPGHSELQS